jgi:hypothetical protein
VDGNVRVVCNRIIDARGNSAESSAWLTVGVDYIVLAINAHPSGSIFLLFDHGRRDIGWWDSRAFTTVDDRPAPNWVSRVDDSGTLAISPASWLEPTFWDEFTEGVEPAIEMYEQERDVILANDRLPH